MLGSTTTIKGNQLESLTRRLLEDLGYIDITTNEIGSGGHELDVRAEFVINSIEQKTVPLICECKAYNRAVDTTAFLKFLGKVYMEETTSGVNVMGCFIALNGVNGNVQGQMRALSARQTISLLTGDRLSQAIRGVCSMCDLERVDSLVDRLGGALVLEYAMCVHEDQAYWVCKLSDDRTTLIGANGNALSATQAEPIFGLLSGEGSWGEYVDLNQLAEHKSKVTIVSKYILADSLLHDVPFEQDSSALIARLPEGYESEGLRDQDAYSEALESLGVMSFIQGSTQQKGTAELTNERIADTFEMLRFLYADSILVHWIKSGFVDALVDDDRFIQHIVSDVQPRLRLTQQDIDSCRSLLKLSPSAFAQAINPHQLLQHSARDLTEEVKESHATTMRSLNTNLFIDSLIQGLTDDYRQSGLHSYYREELGLVELDVTRLIRAKTEKRVLREVETRLRSSILPLSDEHGGGYLRVALKTDLHEPWEKTEDTVAEEE